MSRSPRVRKVKRAREKAALPKEQRCRICGCTWDDACPAACSWYEISLCSVCAELRQALDAFVNSARRVTLAGVKRLYQEVCCRG